MTIGPDPQKGKGIEIEMGVTMEAKGVATYPFSRAKGREFH